jgi:HK97 family phage portal protein
VKSPLGSLLRRGQQVANKAPVPYVARRSGGTWFNRGRGDKLEQMESYGSVGTLFSIVHRTSEATSSYDWWLERVTSDQRRVYGPAEPHRVPIIRHAAIDLVNKPNPFMSRQQLFEVVQQHLDLTGEGWMVLYRDPRFTLPLEIWPVRPDRMHPVPSRDNFLAGYIYRSPDGEEIPLGLDEVITMHYPDPSNLYRGMGPVQSILAELDAAKYSAEWNRNFFLNDATPGGIIEVDKRLGDDEFDELRDRWNEQHRGVANAHRVAILEQGKFVERKFTQRDMQFAELRNVSRDVILEAFAFPKPMLGITEDVNRANAEAGEYVFGKWTVQNRLERWKGALNNKLLPMYGPTGEGVEFCFEDPVPADKQFDASERTSKANAAKTLIDAGYDPDDVLETVGLPTMRRAVLGTPPGMRPKPLGPPPDAPEEEETDA